MSPTKRSVYLAGLVVAALIVSVGTTWAFLRGGGGNDFNVFYQAWSLVVSGHGAEVYRNTPDRFLYAPGFAWILAPLGWLSRDLALAIWCFAKVALLGYIIREFSADLDRERTPLGQLTAAGIAAWALLLVVRPVLIDFQYGQVNLLILGACVWPLCRYLDPMRAGKPWVDGLSWGLFGIAAIAKLYPIPLGLIPFLTSTPISRERKRASVYGMIAGVVFVLVAPIVTQGVQGWLALYPEWLRALVDRGLPLESHNQSFVAFLYHYFSGIPTEIIAQHRHQMELGFALLTSQSITLLAGAWSSALLGLLLAWMIKGARSDVQSRLRFVAIAIGLIILPSHLVWKPYFVFGFPVAILALRNTLARPTVLGILVLASAFALSDLSGFDLIGSNWAARFEAGSALLWAHLLFIWASAALDRSSSAMYENSP